MPFTVAHAAAAAPLWRASGRRLVLSAVVVGTMAPDYEYLLHLRTERTIGHTPAGLFLQCLPASLLVLAVWHLVVKRPLAALLPSRLAPLGAGAGERFPFWPPTRLAWICVSILAGAVSHLVWDSFTHDNGFMVQRLPFLSAGLVGGLDVDEALQYLSGVVGMAALVEWVRRQLPDRRPVSAMAPASAATPSAAGAPATRSRRPLPDRVRRLAVAVILAGGLAGGAGNAGRLVAAGQVGAHGVLVAGVVGAMAAGSVAVTVVSALLQRRV